MIISEVINLNLAQLYRKDLSKSQILRDFIDQGRCVTVSIVEIPGETLEKFLDVIEAVQDTLSIETPQKVLDALAALEV